MKKAYTQWDEAVQEIRAATAKMRAGLKRLASSEIT